ncbi:WD40 repeat-like protein [Rozella allomycis CSF55]|uniref:WD40 repeat-like protein n=1 Tax=Rozella allomycis (strain CSF55) TaxID=988480 RepID=A0A075B1D5_ROZAC|nr:hypothetical protein O9G_001884 [Rozella allomycis CSF55]RKP18751.1 WD40 repeat-like protein [Rozella allomycis CSF55]|eukprot:EPZ34583.1 hypothetical protein O9G_001884 [Rozella allomycis CSF55]
MDINQCINLYRTKYIVQKNWQSGNAVAYMFDCVTPAVVTCLQMDEEKVVACFDDKTVLMWDLYGNLKQSFVGHVGGVWCMQYIGNVLSTGSTDRTIRIWDLQTGECSKWLVGHSSTVRCLQMSEDARLVVSGSRDTTDIETGECLHVLMGHQASVRCLAIKDNYIVSGSYDNSCRVWDICSGELKFHLEGHVSKVYSLCVDNRYIYSGSLDSTINVWSLADGTQIKAIRDHRSLVALLKKNEYNQLISASADGSVKVWDEDLNQLYSLDHNTSAITCLFSKGPWLITGSDKSVKLWKNGTFCRNIMDNVDSVWQVAATETCLINAVHINGHSCFRIYHFDK